MADDGPAMPPSNQIVKLISDLINFTSFRFLILSTVRFFPRRLQTRGYLFRNLRLVPSVPSNKVFHVGKAIGGQVVTQGCVCGDGAEEGEKRRQEEDAAAKRTQRREQATQGNRASTRVCGEGCL